MLGIQLSLADYLEECRHVTVRLNLDEIHRLSDDLFSAWQDGRFVFVCGNGGAGSTAGHFAEDLLKSQGQRALWAGVVSWEELRHGDCLSIPPQRTSCHRTLRRESHGTVCRKHVFE